MFRTRLAAVALGTTALLIPAGVGLAAPSGAGSAGIGDPSYPEYGNGGYDASHYDINVSYRPTPDLLSGTSTMTATATQQLTSFHVDFVLDVSSLTVDGDPAQVQRTDYHELVVTPLHPIAAGETFTMQSTYTGHPLSVRIPSHDASPWKRTSNGAAAVGEPEISAWWYPANDHPRDKATFDIRVTTPPTQEALSNGVLVSHSLVGNRRLWHWRETQPMATYLAMFVTGQFDISRSTSTTGLPIITAVAANGGQAGAYAKKDLARTGEVIRWESRRWGPYPFEALGGVAPAADLGFALENQTRPVYSREFWKYGPDIYVIVHEQAHQWFGDSVSLRSWRDVWINEGFATFTEWLWSEQHDQGTAADLFEWTYGDHPASAPFWKRIIGRPAAGNEFAWAVYERGAMTLQALRTRIGGPAFYTTMRNWAAQHRYGNGSVQGFEALAERVSGQDLGSFFTAWLRTPSRPAATRANGFPVSSNARTASVAGEKAPASWAKIKRVEAFVGR